MLLALAATIQLSSAETILGAYVFHRHGDRTAKSTPPSSLTDLGYVEVNGHGSYYNSRYIANSSAARILGIESDVVKLSQLAVSSPSDNVLQNSAAGWLQGLYPPAGYASNQTLRNGSKVESPLNGFQLIPISITSTNGGSENSQWLQGATNCQNAESSSNDFFNSDLFNSYQSSSLDLYRSVSPAVNGTFNESQLTFKNAYTIWDLLNVALIHNSTDSNPALADVSTDTMHQLFLLANIHEYNLAYNSTDAVRAISGAVLAGQVLTALNSTITGNGKSKLNVQFGAYGTFLSYFGLAGLPPTNAIFTGIPDYASSMAWELVTNATVSANGDFPSTSDISVRFLFNNGTSSSSADLTPYALFGGSSIEIPWDDFVSQTQKFAVTDQQQWCSLCGNTDGACASNTTSSGSGSSTPAAASSSNGSGISTAVAGVIGAMVTLGVILGLEALILLLGGLRLVKKGASAAALSTNGAAEK
ncbi:histidine phosphatase superfamily [Talaromyces proteolyticus]|uniref:Histidine phosphatase superfamily n=1 Tax=Talaromyces proteolyticus TaxID=1131652 RepID=A0AAD4Q0Z7_9EURO|nr:histidine phosphatase superfamily [Talaromyces proteolyticus]KAH8697801.1 histidine phosphatase superfamily [Talaromyces proteolyticus]